jgi:hypothetical protein
VARAPEDVQALVATKPDSLRAVSALIRVEDAELRAAAINELQAGRLTADDLPGYLTLARTNPPAASPPRSPTPSGAVGHIAEAARAATQNGTGMISPAAGMTGTTEPAAPTITPVGAGKGSPPVSTSSEDQDDVAQARIGYGTLMTAFRALTKYRDRLEERSEISIREQVTLIDLKNLILDLYEHYGSGDVDQPDR